MNCRLPTPRRRFPAPRHPYLEELETRCLPSVNVLTYHNDLASTGQNLNETALTRGMVNAATFGKLYQARVDGQVYAQPLVDTGVTITTGSSPGLHDVVFAATQHDSLYAIDADNAGPGNGGIILWQRSFLTLDANDALPGATSVTSVPAADVSSGDITPEIGITGTPVIDPNTGTLYLVTKTKEIVAGVAHYVQRIHAIDISDGSDRVTPFLIGDTSGSYVNNTSIWVNGVGDGSDGQGHVYFNALRALQRASLTLVGGTVYVAWASHGDNGPYHGWVAGFDPATLAVKAVFNATPNGSRGGIWMAGGALSSDGTYLYFETGNGTFDGSNGNTTNVPGNGAITGLNAAGFPVNSDFGDSVLKVAVDATSSPANQNPNGWGLAVVDYFTPFDQAYLDGRDLDLGSGAPLVLPDSAGSAAIPHLLVGAGKEGIIYLINRDNLGKYGDNDNVVEKVGGQLSGSLDTAAYYNGTVYYVEGYGGNAKTFSIANAAMSSAPTSRSTDSFAFAGSTPAVSADGVNDGIIWDIDRGTNELRAYSSDSYATELYTSDQAAGNRDALGAAVKFQVASVANGRVYVGAGTGNPNNFLVVYGLIQPPNAVPNAPTGLNATAVSASQINLAWTNNDAFPNSATGYDVEQSSDGMNFTQIGVAGAGVNGFASGGLTASTTYYFRVRAFNSLGYSAYTTIQSATTFSQAGALDFSSGFAGSNSLLTYNGAAKINGALGELTDAGMTEAGSIFSTTPVNITQFTTNFTFQIHGGTSPEADGFTFAIQNVGPTALGVAGGGLGYGPDHSGGTGGIPSSVAIKFDLFSNEGEGSDSTGLYTDGAAPTVAGSIDLSATPIDLHSGHDFSVAMSYDGATLQVVITDVSTGLSASQSYSIGIPATVGAKTAYVGFTGATGSLTALQDLLTWTFLPPQPPAIPQNLTAVVTGYTAGSQTPVPLGAQVSWSSVPGATSYEVDRKLGASGTYAQVALITGNGATTFNDSGLATQASYFYRVRGINNAGAGAYSSDVGITTPALAATPTNGQAAPVGVDFIKLSWTDNANNEDGFQIFRQVNGGGFTLLTSLPPDTNPAPSTDTFTDNGLLSGTAYDYHIQAFNLAGYSDFAGVSTMTLTLPPTATSAVPSQEAVSLFWTAPTGAATFNIYRSAVSGGEGPTPIATGIATSSYTDTGLTAGVTYFYEITAEDQGGESSPSAEVSATALADPNEAPLFAVGPDFGHLPVVNVYDETTGRLRFSFDAYDPRYFGGVRVAVADVNGDGVPDIITGPGPYSGPNIRVFDGVTGQQLPGPVGSFMAFDPNQVSGGVFVAAGEFDGDTHADIVVGEDAGGQPLVRVFSGLDGHMIASFYAYAPAFPGGVRVAVADINGDGHDDIITGAGPGGGPHVEVFDGTNFSHLLLGFMAYAPTFTGGVYVAGANPTTAGGKGKVITGPGLGGLPYVKIYDGGTGALLAQFLAYNQAFRGGVRVGLVTGFSTDGMPDIITGPGFSGGPDVEIFDLIDQSVLDGFFAFEPDFSGGIYVGGL